MSVSARRYRVCVAHPVHEFWAELASLPGDEYPDGVVPVRDHIQGTAFFSGGAGLYITDPGAPLPPFPYGGLMFVGHNLDAEEPYLARVESGKAHGDPRWPMKTWRNLYRLLALADVDPAGCFFTNIYVGLIAGSKPTGKFPGARDEQFTRWCAAFLSRQMETMQPRAVVMLGSEVRRFFGVSDVEGSLSRAGHRLPYVALAHPSMHPANVAKRGGVEGEAELLRLASAGRGS